jgi:hypothetical protein
VLPLSVSCRHTVNAVVADCVNGPVARKMRHVGFQARMRKSKHNNGSASSHMHMHMHMHMHTLTSAQSLAIIFDLHTASVELHPFLHAESVFKLVGARRAKPSDLPADMEDRPSSWSLTSFSALGEVRL